MEMGFDRFSPIHVTLFDGSEIIANKVEWDMNQYGVHIQEGSNKIALIPWAAIIKVHQFTDD